MDLAGCRLTWFSEMYTGTAANKIDDDDDDDDDVVQGVCNLAWAFTHP